MWMQYIFQDEMTIICHHGVIINGDRMKSREGKVGNAIYDLSLTPHIGSHFLKEITFNFFHSLKSLSRDGSSGS